MSDGKETAQEGVYHILLFAFDGQKTAGEKLKQLKSSQKDEKYSVLEHAIVERDEKGRVKVKQPGRGGWGAGIGGGTGAALALLGGPVGLAGAVIVGAVTGGAIGHFVGRNFKEEDLKAAAAALPPNSSGYVALVQDTGAEELIKEMQGVNASIVTLTAGSELTGALVHAVSADVDVELEAEEDAEANAAANEGNASADSSATTGAPPPSNAAPAEG